jgi:hypothetical protein
MLRELGYELVDEAAHQQHEQELQQQDLGTTYDPEAPLPSYELEED